MEPDGAPAEPAGGEVDLAGAAGEPDGGAAAGPGKRPHPRPVGKPGPSARRGCDGAHEAGAARKAAAPAAEGGPAGSWKGTPLSQMRKSCGPLSLDRRQRRGQGRATLHAGVPPGDLKERPWRL